MSKGFFFDTFSRSKKDWEILRKEEFEKAKLLSDFVGFIIRLAFCFYATFFFFRSIDRERDDPMNIVYAGSAVISLVFTLRFATNIYGVVRAYFLSDVSVNAPYYVKFLFLSLATSTTLLIWVGMIALVTSLPDPSP